jgi:hypothetical protein
VISSNERNAVILSLRQNGGLPGRGLLQAVLGRGLRPPPGRRCAGRRGLSVSPAAQDGTTSGPLAGAADGPSWGAGCSGSTEGSHRHQSAPGPEGYDADTTVALFAAHLNDAVDLDSVRDDLASVVQRALEPAHVSVWINHRD